MSASDADGRCTSLAVDVPCRRALELAACRRRRWHHSDSSPCCPTSRLSGASLGVPSDASGIAHCVVRRVTRPLEPPVMRAQRVTLLRFATTCREARLDARTNVGITALHAGTFLVLPRHHICDDNSLAQKGIALLSTPHEPRHAHRELSKFVSWNCRGPQSLPACVFIAEGDSRAIGTHRGILELKLALPPRCRAAHRAKSVRCGSSPQFPESRGGGRRQRLNTPVEGHLREAAMRLQPMEFVHVLAQAAPHQSFALGGSAQKSRRCLTRSSSGALRWPP